jgi:hypothetical protein
MSGVEAIRSASLSSFVYRRPADPYLDLLLPHCNVIRSVGTRREEKKSEGRREAEALLSRRKTTLFFFLSVEKKKVEEKI